MLLTAIALKFPNRGGNLRQSRYVANRGQFPGADKRGVDCARSSISRTRLRSYAQSILVSLIIATGLKANDQFGLTLKPSRWRRDPAERLS